MATMVVKRVKDTEINKVFVHKIADIRGGVSIKTSELGGDYIPEGTVLSAPIDGICHVVKVAQLFSEYSGATTLQVKKNSCFNIGDKVMTKVGGKAHSITKIDYKNKNYDVITISTGIDAASKGGYLIEAKADSTADQSELKYEPLSLVGTGKVFHAGDNVDTDAWVIGVTRGNSLPESISTKLKGIINY